VLSLDNPPVNALSLALREGLLQALIRAAADDQAAAIVLIGAGRDFSAGGDIKEMGSPKAARGPRMRDLHSCMEASGKPVVAALSGYALGGGLELALACQARIASPGAVLGLPEIALGLLPGGGGTVRLPKIIGAEAALDIMLSARRISSGEALRLGLADRVADDLRRVAIEEAGRLAKDAPSAVSREIPPADPVVFERARAWAARVAPGRVAAARIIDCVEVGNRCSLPEALEYATKAYAELAFGEGEGARQHRQRVAEFIGARRPAGEGA
jgi:3-hydroxyacyl-CoA dehydrogenase